MKGIAFTLDAIFALFVAGAGITILLYFQYTGQTPYVVKYSESSTLLNAIAGTHVNQVTANPLMAAIANQGLGANETWPQYAKDSSNDGSNPYGPIYPGIASVITVPSNIVDGTVVADYGNVYFAAGTNIYAYSVNGTFLWTRNIGVSPPTLALYSGTVIYAYLNGVAALNAYNGTPLWSTNPFTNILGISSPITIYDGKILVGVDAQNDANRKVYAIYANNGTFAWKFGVTVKDAMNVTSLPGSVLFQNDKYLSLITEPQQGTPVQIWLDNIPSHLGGLATYGNVIGIGATDHNNAYIVNANGTLINTTITGSKVRGAAQYKGLFVFQAQKNVSAVASNGSVVWNVGIPSQFGQAPVAAVPVMSSIYAYTLWGSGYLVAQNLTNGNIVWNMRLPYVSQALHMAMAYGRLYVPVGNSLIAVGTCSGNANSTLLSIAATSYLNGYGSCASGIFSSLRSFNNYTFLINYKDKTRVAQFNGKSSYIVASGSNNMTNLNLPSNFTISLWFMQNGTLSSVGYMLNKLSGGNGYDVDAGTGDEANSLEVCLQSCYASNRTYSLNNWHSGVAVFAVNTLKLYIDGKPSGVFGSISIPRPSSSDLHIGSGSSGTQNFFKGNIANVQIYTVAASPQQIIALSSEGVGGTPIQNLGLTAWWPLSGDANDYSGLGNGASPSNITYIPANYVTPAFKNAFEVRSAGVTMSLINYSTGLRNNYNVSLATWR